MGLPEVNHCWRRVHLSLSPYKDELHETILPFFPFNYVIVPGRCSECLLLRLYDSPNGR